MQQKRLAFVRCHVLWIGFFIHGMGRFAEAAGLHSYPEEWLLGERLLTGALFLIAIGWLTGAFAFLFIHIAPSTERLFLYPLLKVIGTGGEKKSLMTKK